MKQLRVLLADDHGLIAEGIRKLLEQRYQVVDIVDEGQALLETALRTKPDLILTDLSMPGLDGLEATRQLRQKLPKVPVIILTMHGDSGHVKAAFAAGAAGYLVKSSAPKELFDAIDEVLAGRNYLTPVIANHVIDSLLSPPSKTPNSVSSTPTLTRREIEISNLVAQGLENSEISSRLCIAQVTVRTHYRRILQKLGLRNRVELTRYVITHR